MKKLLISLAIVVTIFSASVIKADIIDDCIKCPGLQAIFDTMYIYIEVA